MSRPFALCSRLFLLAAAAFASLAASAQPFPSRPIRVFYPGAPGGSVEQAIRVIATEAGRTLGQPIVVEAKPGANGLVALNAVKQSAGDPHVLTFLTNGTLVTLPLASPDTHVDAGRDFVPVSVVLSTNLVIVAHPSAPFRDAAGMIAYAKANPGRLDCAVVGTASNTHLALELLKFTTGIDVRNVPYKGEAQLIPDVLGGTVRVGIASSTAKPHVDTGKLIAIATTGPHRWGVFPNVPTVRESGVSNYSVVGWFGLVAPPGTSPEIAARLTSAFNGALAVPAVKKAVVEGFGLDLIGTSAAEMTALIKSERELWEPVIRRAGIRME